MLPGRRQNMQRIDSQVATGMTTVNVPGLQSKVILRKGERTTARSSPVQGKLDTEDLLDKKGVNWTSIRPVYIYGERCLTLCYERLKSCCVRPKAWQPHVRL